MRRLFPDYAYGPGPRQGCWWDETCDLPGFDPLDGDTECDVVIVGGGFTGVSAALHLARAGTSVVVLDANRIGWGASGRNGGFCCLGGGMASDAALDRHFGRDGRRRWRGIEMQSVALVSKLIADLSLDVDRHSRGETQLAHSAGQVRGFEAQARAVQENYGVAAEVIDGTDLAAQGFGGPFHGGLTIPLGFGLNPRKYLAGLVRAAQDAGARFHDHSAVTGIEGTWARTTRGTVKAGRVIVATNGYTSEDLPGWIAARFMPAQSSVLITAPIPPEMRAAQGWTTDQMCYDTRTLLHYFRMLPDGRFLFGMRGGLRGSAAGERAARARVERDFRAMFPAWAEVLVTHVWSGMVCLSPTWLPIVGQVPGAHGVLVGLAYHGNGVAMGTWTGAKLARMALGDASDGDAAMLAPAERRFPLGRFRRALMPPAYALYRLRDALS